MKKRNSKKLVVLVFVFLLTTSIAFAQEDREGCKDHPMFTRMPNFYIGNCKEKDFDKAEFVDEKDKDIKVEGKFYWTEYEIKKGIKAPSELQILRNYENAIKKIGGVVVNESGGLAYLKLIKAGKTYWVIVFPRGNGTYYELTIVEKAEMAQEVVADAKSLMSDIQTRGHASVYGIHFDFDKANIKPESEPAIKEIAKLLQENKGLKLYVIGHTDNVGTIDYNMKLSKLRADAVMKELVTKYKISSERLKAFGVGSLAPVTSNKTDDGRAQNRRVELVEQ
ncbi:MAG: OmpA family protein [Nitrospira sp.]|nr:OmpA family protein [Nitrospira sp.]